MFNKDGPKKFEETHESVGFWVVLEWEKERVAVI
jgi:hypothetical protein